MRATTRSIRAVSGALHHHDSQDASRGHARERSNARILGIAVGLTLSFAAVELIASIMSGSVALMADAGHMVTDSTALLLALIAQIVAMRPPNDTSSYGFGRIEALAAFVNSLVMLGVIAWIVMTAFDRLQNPRDIAGQTVMVVAGIGLLINLLVAWLLSKDQDSINTRAALIHVMGDLLGSIAAIVSGFIIFFTGWAAIDPLLSIFVCLLLLKSTLLILKNSYRILMEHVPGSVDFQAVGQDLLGPDTIRSVHNLHVWEISPGHIALSAHLEVSDLAVWPSVLKELQLLLREKHGIDHATLQPELETVTT